MSDLTTRRVRLSVDLVSLIPDLAIMVRIDLAMMNFGLEVTIKQHVQCVRMALFSSACCHLFCTIDGLPEEPPVDKHDKFLILVYQLIHVCV